MVIKYLLKLFLVLFFFVSINQSKADFFKDITSLIDNNDFRLSYGVSVTDINQDNMINIQDIIVMVNFILDGRYERVADMNEDDSVDILDIVELINIILSGEGL